MEVTKPYRFIGFGAMDATKPYKFIGFGITITQMRAATGTVTNRINEFRDGSSFSAALLTIA